MSTATLPPPLTKKDFQTDQEDRCCPGCGDYAILSAVQSVFPELGIKSENFVVRSVDVFQSHLKNTVKHAAVHKGSGFVEILQNCNIFNDGAWFSITEREARSENVLQLEHGKPLVFGKNRDKGIRRKPDGDIEVVPIGNGISESHLIVHDAHHPRPSYAFLLSHMEHRPGFPTPIGVLRAWDDLPRYEDVMNQQIKDVIAKRGPGDLNKLLHAGDTWEVR